MSILDNEDDLMDKMRVIPISSILNEYDKGYLIEQGRVKYIKDKGVFLNIDVGFRDQYTIKMLDDKYIDNIYYIKKLSLYFIRNHWVKKEEIHVDRVNELKIHETDLKLFNYRRFKIDRVDELFISVYEKNFKENWQEVINYFNPTNINISSNNYYASENMGFLKDVSTNILTINCRMFKDFHDTVFTQKFIMTKDNAEILDDIFANNKFKELHIENSIDVPSLKVIKSNSRGSRFGYKIINI